MLSLLAAVYLPFLQHVLRTVGLSWHDWLLLAALTLVNVGLIELVKVFFIRRAKYDTVKP